MQEGEKIARSWWGNKQERWFYKKKKPSGKQIQNSKPEQVKDGWKTPKGEYIYTLSSFSIDLSRLFMRLLVILYQESESTSYLEIVEDKGNCVNSHNDDK